jgi:hypothetical protein
VNIILGSEMRRMRVLMLAGADLIDSMNVPDLWSVEDVSGEWFMYLNKLFILLVL